MLPSEQVVQNVLSIALYIGGPIIPLLLLAVMIGNWHKANFDPEAEAKDEENQQEVEELGAEMNHQPNEAQELIQPPAKAEEKPDTVGG